MIDPIADFLTRIRNAQTARQKAVEAPYSQIKHQIAEVMKKNGFIETVEKIEIDKAKPTLKVTLIDRKITLKRISHCGQRIYIKSPDIRKVVNGFGISIISTSQGIMTGYEARSKNIGGEYLCEVS